jgi:hypothetical protein
MSSGYIHSIIDIDKLFYRACSIFRHSDINDPNDVNADNKSLKIDINNRTIENYPIYIIGLSLKEYYSRSNSMPVKNVRIRPNIKLAGRAWINTMKYRTMMNETRRDNQYLESY